MDFDGTITDRDTFDVLVELFAGPDVWAGTERGLADGTATIRDVLQVQAGYVRGDFDTIYAILRREIRVDSTFPDLVRFCAANHAELTVVSSGIEPVIRKRLGEMGLTGIAIVANGVDPDPAGWKLLYRDGSPNGTDKAALLRAATARGMRTIYVGDGRSDFAAAMLADRRFAKRGLPLETYLRQRSIAFQPFSSFAEVIAALQGDVCDAR